ncbi:DUF6503 family protein [Gillisia sp. Q332]|uniref:DUF6503 family protein n=1 Tax=Gillisia xinjiangensis TaxID=3384765 RepID=UPI00391B3EDF
MKQFIILLVTVFFISCQEEKNEITAEEIIDKTIENAGGANYRKATIDFKFRDYTYKSIRNGGEFQLERRIVDSTGISYRDVINNTGYQRFKNDSLIKVPDSMATKYTGSVNSVHYFAHLPYGLNDKAVNKELVGEAEIAGAPYYEVKISFQQEGGGADHHDVFMYWIHKNDFTIDYLAYKFQVDDGGIRFRKAFKERVIEGIRFADYENYKIEDFSTPLEDLDELYEAGKLEFLSTIETENIEVKIRS